MDALSSLPPSLHIDILSEMLQRVVKDFEPFKQCEEAFIRRLVCHVGCVAYIAGETIFSASETSDTVHFIYNGRASMMSPTGKPLSYVEEYGCLEEMALLGSMKYKHDCVCVTPCDILTLRYENYKVRSSYANAFFLCRLSFQSQQGTIDA
jgi:signal-transduction protein with cAMP-binding, CBS, and nucleotidyltransferase domain